MSTDQVLALFNQMNDNLDTIDANQGLGQLGWWPPEGEYECILEAIELTQGKYKYGPQNSPKEVPSALVTFHYRLTDDPDAPGGQPRSFKGRAFNIPAVPMSSLPEDETNGKHQTRVRIEKERLLGCLTTLLGAKPSTGWAPAIQTAMQMLETAKAANRAVVVKVRCAYRDKTTGRGAARKVVQGSKIPDQEYIQELVSGASA